LTTKIIEICIPCNDLQLM